MSMVGGGDNSMAAIGAVLLLFAGLVIGGLIAIGLHFLT